MSSKRVRLVRMLAVAGLAASLLVSCEKQSKTSAGNSSERKILYYQSPMHPWVKSDKPGKCTVCGMELVPVYEGAQPVEATSDVVLLPPGAPHVASIKTVEVRRQPL